MKTVPLIVRFWRHIEIDVQTQCWNWTGKLINSGYGLFGVGTKKENKFKTSHRWSYEYFRGSIIKPFTVDHLCHNRICCNPFHLEVVSQKENVRRGEGILSINYRKTRCKWGHEFTSENTRIIKLGRKCKECEREANRKAYRRRKEIIYAS